MIIIRFVIIAREYTKYRLIVRFVTIYTYVFIAIVYYSNCKYL